MIRYLLSIWVLSKILSLHAANPSFQSFDPADFTTDNLVIKLKSKGGSLWSTNGNGYITPNVLTNFSAQNVKWYGAVGNGGTVDYASIQAALNTKLDVYIPDGVYLITNTLVVLDHQKLYGSGTIKEAPGSILAPMITIAGTNSTIEGLTLISSETDLTWDLTLAQSRAGIGIYGEDGTVRNVKVFNKSTGIHALGARYAIDDNMATNGWMNAGLVATNNGYVSSAIYANVILTKGGRIRGNYVSGHGQGILVGYTSLAVLIQGNTIFNTHDNAIYITSGNDCSVIGNTIYDCVQDGIKMRGFRNVASGNTIKGGLLGIIVSAIDLPPDPGSSEEAYSIAAGLPFNGYGSVISGNTIQRTSVRGIEVAKLSTAPGNYMHGCLIIGNTVEEGAAANDDGIMVAGFDHRVIGNTVTGTNAAVAGIQVWGNGNMMRGVTVQGNHVYMPNAAQGILLGSSFDLSVSENHIDNGSNNAISVLGCNGVSLMHNICTNGYLNFVSDPSTNIYVANNIANACNFSASPVSGEILFNQIPNLDLTATNCHYFGNLRWDQDSLHMGQSLTNEHKLVARQHVVTKHSYTLTGTNLLVDFSLGDLQYNLNVTNDIYITATNIISGGFVTIEITAPSTNINISWDSLFYSLRAGLNPVIPSGQVGVVKLFSIADNNPQGVQVEFLPPTMLDWIGMPLFQAGLKLGNTFSLQSSNFAGTGLIPIASVDAGDKVILSPGGLSPVLINGNVQINAHVLLTHPTNVGGLYGPGWYCGIGSPEGSQAAVIGSFYSRLDGGTTNAFWVKETGTNEFGWAPK